MPTTIISVIQILVALVLGGLIFIFSPLYAWRVRCRVTLRGAGEVPGPVHPRTRPGLRPLSPSPQYRVGLPVTKMLSNRINTGLLGPLRKR